MGSLSEELINSTDAIVQRWYEAWRNSTHPHRDVSEELIKSKLALQLRTIGEQIAKLTAAENPEQMWQSVARLDPELRIGQNIAIEEVVQEYSLAVDVVRSWLEERKIEVPFNEYSYFHKAFFELTAESVRRYSIEQAKRISEERALHLATIAHQMRGPLSSFAVLLYQIRESRNAGYDVKQSVVDMAQRNLERLLSLIEGVLKLERFKPGEICIRPQMMHPVDVVRNVLADNEHDANAKGVRLENFVDQSLQMSIDPTLFLDAMSNVVQNAVKFTQSGFVRVSAEEHGEDVIFKVSDSGPGIPEEQQKTLFRTIQPGSKGGSGIGLLILERAVTAAGGTFGVQSELGKGSEFWFRIPRCIAPREWR